MKSTSAACSSAINPAERESAFCISGGALHVRWSIHTRDPVVVHVGNARYVQVAIDHSATWVARLPVFDKGLSMGARDRPVFARAYIQSKQVGMAYSFRLSLKFGKDKRSVRPSARGSAFALKRASSETKYSAAAATS